MQTRRDHPLPGTKDSRPRDYEPGHRALARRAAAQGIVLLKNDGGLLPLPAGARVALYGAGALHLVKGGTGSGDVNARETVELCEGMRQAGFSVVNQAWLNACEAAYSHARAAWRDEIWRRIDTGEQPHFFAAYVNTPFRAPALPPPEEGSFETAFYVIRRTAGEGADRTPDAGDYRLSESEERDLRCLCAMGKPVVLVLNTGGVVDLSILDELPGIRAVLVLSQPGMEGGSAFADVVSGRVTPCGRLTDSWAFRYEDYPCVRVRTENEDPLTEVCREGVFVGYRYFDTFSVPVRYGFGWGLSYTEFSWSLEQMTCREELVRLQVRVTNTGSRYSGRETVQVYATCPPSGAAREFRRLVAFAKTDLLAPGAGQTLTVELPLEALTVFDPGQSSWKWSRGSVFLWIGPSLEQAEPAGVLVFEQETIREKTGRLWPDAAQTDTLFPDPAADRERREALRAHAAQNGLPRLTVRPAARPSAPRTPDAAARRAERIADGLPDEMLARFCVGHWSREPQGPLGAEGLRVPGSAGETCGALEDGGVPALVLADGPAGLRLSREYFARDGRPVQPPVELGFEGGYLAREEPASAGERYYQFCTAFPVGTLLAQSWDEALVAEVGRAVGDEMARFGVALWLAPGMNLHRDPLCGRNFEYFSEDPLLSGRMARAMTAGVQAVPGRGTTIKHFACNNRENGRTEVNCVVSERTLRELYLKGFEIAVQGPVPPAAIMTSYNLVNGVHAANSAALCTRIAREEWGYDGLIMSDWDTTAYGRCTADGCLRAGNDLIMPGSPRDYDELLTARQAGTLPRTALRQCAARVIRTALRLAGAKKDENDP